jgi:uncharacterized protein YqeY
MSSLYARLRADIVKAMKAQDRDRATILRTNDAAIQRAAMDGNVPIDDGLVVATLRKAVKTLAAANEEFARGGRDDLIAANRTEIAVIETYLPVVLEGEALAALVDEAVQATGATTKREMGAVMAWLKRHPAAEQLDFGAVSKLLQTRLS